MYVRVVMFLHPQVPMLLDEVEPSLEYLDVGCQLLSIHREAVSLPCESLPVVPEG